MPLYELFAIAKPQLGKQAIGSMMKAIASKVLQEGGVVTDIRSYGDRKLAYDIRQPGTRYSEAAMWQINFAVKPELLPELDHTLRVDERMLRWLVFKRRPYSPLPTPYRVARTAESVAGPLAQQQAAAKKKH